MSLVSLNTADGAVIRWAYVDTFDESHRQGRFTRLESSRVIFQPVGARNSATGHCLHVEDLSDNVDSGFRFL